MKKAKVNKEACIACGACAAICPEVFILDDEGLSESKNVPENNEENEEMVSALESCPTEAIYLEEEL